MIEDQVFKHTIFNWFYTEEIRGMKGLVIVDEKLNITYIDEFLAEFAGYSLTEALQMNALEVIEAEDIFNVLDEQEKRSQGESSCYDLNLILKSGKQVPVSVYSQSIIEEDQFMGSHLQIEFVQDPNPE